MTVISPSAFAPPAASPLSGGSQGPLPRDLREQVRRLERAHSAARAGQAAVPLGVAEIDALLPEGGLLTGALHEIEAGPAPSGRRGRRGVSSASPNRGSRRSGRPRGPSGNASLREWG